MSKKILSLDKQVNQLIDDIRNSDNLEISDLLKAKVSFQLTKINLGLRLITRVLKLYNLQEMIEDRMLNENQIQDLSMRELLVMSSVNSKRLDNYFGKMDKILGSINLRELEGSLLILSEISNKEKVKELADDSTSEDLRSLSLELLSTISKLPPKFEEIEDIDYSEEDDAEELEKAIDKIGELDE